MSAWELHRCKHRTVSTGGKRSYVGLDIGNDETQKDVSDEDPKKGKRFNTNQAAFNALEKLIGNLTTRAHRCGDCDACLAKITGGQRPPCTNTKYKLVQAFQRRFYQVYGSSAGHSSRVVPSPPPAAVVPVPVISPELLVIATSAVLAVLAGGTEP